MRFLIRVLLSLIYALLAQALFVFLRDVRQELRKRREANLKEATLNNVVPMNRRKIYPCTESWPNHRDPTHGQIDWDIQWHVAKMSKNRDQAFVLGLNLQRLRNGGRSIAISKPNMEEATEVAPARILHHIVKPAQITGQDIVRSIHDYERRGGRRRMQ